MRTALAATVLAALVARPAGAADTKAAVDARAGEVEIELPGHVQAPVLGAAQLLERAVDDAPVPPPEGREGLHHPIGSPFTDAVASGPLNFHWSYFSTDSGTYDSAYFLLNGVPTFLADNGSQGSGNFSIALTSGSIFGFRVHTADNLFGDGELTISQFSAPVPEGSTLSLLALGALGVAMVMRRRAQAAA